MFWRHQCLCQVGLLPLEQWLIFSMFPHVTSILCRRGGLLYWKGTVLLKMLYVQEKLKNKAKNHITKQFFLNLIDCLVSEWGEASQKTWLLTIHLSVQEFRKSGWEAIELLRKEPPAPKSHKLYSQASDQISTSTPSGWLPIPAELDWMILQCFSDTWYKREMEA